MEFFEVIDQRHSIRVFDSRPIEPEKLDRILETARRAPSAGNLQSYEIYLVNQVRKRSALAQAANAQGFILVAPVSLVFCANPALAIERYGQRGRRLFSVQDATIACSFAMLAATAVGLASVWVGAFDDDAVRRVIGAPEDILPVAILPIGYAAGEPERKERRALGELVHRV